MATGWCFLCKQIAESGPETTRYKSVYGGYSLPVEKHRAGLFLGQKRETGKSPDEPHPEKSPAEQAQRKHTGRSRERRRCAHNGNGRGAPGCAPSLNRRLAAACARRAGRLSPAGAVPGDAAAPPQPPGQRARGSSAASCGHAARVLAGAGAGRTSRCVCPGARYPRPRSAAAGSMLCVHGAHAGRARATTPHPGGARGSRSCAAARASCNPRSPLAPRAASDRSGLPLSAGL